MTVVVRQTVSFDAAVVVSVSVVVDVTVGAACVLSPPPPIAAPIPQLAIMRNSAPTPPPTIALRLIFDDCPVGAG